MADKTYAEEVKDVVDYWAVGGEVQYTRVIRTDGQIFDVPPHGSMIIGPGDVIEVSWTLNGKA